jgi:hypothetical protein
LDSWKLEPRWNISALKWMDQVQPSFGLLLPSSLPSWGLALLRTCVCPTSWPRVCLSSFCLGQYSARSPSHLPVAAPQEAPSSLPVRHKLTSRPACTFHQRTPSSSPLRIPHQGPKLSSSPLCLCPARIRYHHRSLRVPRVDRPNHFLRGAKHFAQARPSDAACLGDRPSDRLWCPGASSSRALDAPKPHASYRRIASAGLSVRPYEHWHSFRKRRLYTSDPVLRWPRPSTMWTD